MDTYTPLRAMIVCTGGTGDYIKKEDAVEVLRTILGENCQELIEAFLKSFGK